jgi:hypothetical protein
MATTPTGLPVWTRTSDISFYGGDANKANHQSVGVVNPKTDISAEEWCRVTADITAMARTAPFCIITFTMDDNSPGAPAVHSVNMMTGINTAGYEGDAPPTGFPTLARVSNGRATITFASSYEDEYGVSGDLVIYHGNGTCHSTVSRTVNVEVDSGTNEVDVIVTDSSGTAVTNPKVTAVIY